MEMKRMVIRALVAAILVLQSCCHDMPPLMGGNTGAVPSKHDTAFENVGLPIYNVPADGRTTLWRTAYTASYNRSLKLPDWVAWHLTAEHTDGDYGRKGMKFAEDSDVPAPRATDRDYYNSGYDRGHMCPAADCKWSETVQKESFLFTNACPQNPGLNSGDWNEMEILCRRWAKEYGDIYIVCGPIMYRNSNKRIGKNKVAVPDAFFKVVLRMGNSPKAIGFIYKNESGNRPKSSYVNTVDEVERITGLDFFSALPDNIETRVEATASLAEWGIYEKSGR